MAFAAAAAAAAPLRRLLLLSLNPTCLFSSVAPSSGSFSFPRALRPAGLLPSDMEDSDDSNTGDGAAEHLRKSRNDLKREARRAVQWGMDLAKFSPLQIKRILRASSLDREVFDALMLVKKFGPDVREGKRRQFNYIDQLSNPSLHFPSKQPKRSNGENQLQRSWSGFNLDSAASCGGSGSGSGSRYIAGDCSDTCSSSNGGDGGKSPKCWPSGPLPGVNKVHGPILSARAFNLQKRITCGRSRRQDQFGGDDSQTWEGNYSVTKTRRSGRLRSLLRSWLGASSDRLLSGGCEGRAEIFAALHRASCQPKTFVGSGGEKIVVVFGSINFRLRDEYALRFPAKAINARWYTDWILRWFYAEVGASSRLAGPLREIHFRKEALVHSDLGQLEARLNLLQKISHRLSMRDLAEEFLGLQISPLMAN
ncbi:hypothetical protein GUJ93_ZPchr0015g7008 [Zizania palustris]|uniref:Uncharacterized protein n=1 Tax=Zizania palustris TaxID=103762 RepID=A0A8J5W715_ZIZPA|nr:hypothetical protein GUJ93_ZPchr0015g7008 [Zizania palustris]